MNRLSQASSAYLRHAAHQKIDWHPWSEDAFDLAGREDKPVFLSSGAVWCHWCHVMAKESFEDEETARLMNDLFINIKLDRDEMPDIDRRYQQAVAAMGGGSGWPLSVFLTPGKEPFYGGTYFPPSDRQGRPGFKNVLKSVSAFYKTKKDDARTFAIRVMEALKAEPLVSGVLDEAMVLEAEKSMLAAFDGNNGGFGDFPKFPMPGAIEFLLLRSRASENPSIAQAARKTLETMAAGGFHDHLGGGFHRYSTDEAWIVPHFEKMADDNAGLLNIYVDGYSVFGDERFRNVALGIIAFIRRVLSDPNGGFFASQDADVTPEDEGGYFTWTEEELKNALNDEEYAVLSQHLFDERAAMPHDSRKKVLYQALSPDEVAARMGKTTDDVRRYILSGKEKLLSVRDRREPPFIDTTLYTSLNCMLIASFLHASAVLGDGQSKQFALRSLDRILGLRFVKGELFHADNIPAMFDDYVHLIDALISAYEVTGDTGYRTQADDFMASCLAKFYDRIAGGFFDTESEVLGTRMKRIEDMPHPSANALAVMQLMKLHHLMGKEEYRVMAEQTLGIFAETARDIGVHAGAYYFSLDAWYRMVRLTVDARPGSKLANAVLAHARRSDVIVYGGDYDRVTLCMNDRCFAAIRDADGVTEFFKNLPRP